MRNKLIVMTILIISFMSACSVKDINGTDIYIDNHQLYLKQIDSTDCVNNYSYDLYETVEYTFKILNKCNEEYVIEYEGDYISLKDYLKINDVKREELISSNVGVIVYKDSLITEFSIQIEKLELQDIEFIVVGDELQGAYLHSNARIVKVESIDLSVLLKGVYDVLGQEISVDEYCTSYGCKPYGIHPEILLNLTNEDMQFTLSFQKSTNTIYFEINDSEGEYPYVFIDITVSDINDFSNIYTVLVDVFEQHNDN